MRLLGIFLLAISLSCTKITRHELQGKWRFITNSTNEYTEVIITDSLFTTYVTHQGKLKIDSKAYIPITFENKKAIQLSGNSEHKSDTIFYIISNDTLTTLNFSGANNFNWQEELRFVRLH